MSEIIPITKDAVEMRRIIDERNALARRVERMKEDYAELERHLGRAQIRIDKLTWQVEALTGVGRQ